MQLPGTSFRSWPYTPLNMKARGLEGVGRASFSHLNAAANVDRLAHALNKMQ